MNLKTILLCALIGISVNSIAQVNDTINKTDGNGKKQGHWIKKYPDGKIMYDGYFKDDRPVGSFKRFYGNGTLHSIQLFTDDGKEAQVSIYHPNGFIASRGRFVNQLKEGKWLFYSASTEGYLVCEEEYQNNIKNGPSIKYYPDSSLLEKLYYVNDLRHGEWIQYFYSGTACLKANYINGKLQGKFEVFFENGKPEYDGQYNNDTRDGTWHIYNSDGTLKYKVEYMEGIARSSDLYKKESDFFDALEKNKGKIADPEKTGTIW